jgi:uncharacterized protein (TIGR02453 family)
MAEPRYVGFDQKTLTFLDELKANNNRDWFAENKARYEEHVLDLALRFIQSMQAPLEEIAPHFVAVPTRVGGSLMRVYRDTRFSPNKLPYKTNIGIQFRHAMGKDVHAPGCYVHVALDGCFIGMGMYHPDGEALKQIRARIDEEQKTWKRVSTDPKLTALFRMGGDSLKRAPRGYDPEHPFLEDLKRKDHILVADISDRDALSAKLPDLCMDHFAAGKKHMKFLCDAIGVPF